MHEDNKFSFNYQFTIKFLFKLTLYPTGTMKFNSLSTTALLLTLLPPTTLAAPTVESCAKCNETAHGFASLNGGTKGGWGGKIVTVDKYEDLVKYAAATEPLVIRVKGTLKADPKGFEIPIASDKTIIGIGKTGAIVGGGFGIKNTRNIILRNLAISDTYIPTDYNGKTEDWDGIQVDNGTNLVCFSPCFFFGGM